MEERPGEACRAGSGERFRLPEPKEPVAVLKEASVGPEAEGGFIKR